MAVPSFLHSPQDAGLVSLSLFPFPPQAITRSGILQRKSCLARRGLWETGLWQRRYDITTRRYLFLPFDVLGSTGWWLLFGLQPGRLKWCWCDQQEDCLEGKVWKCPVSLTVFEFADQRAGPHLWVFVFVLVLQQPTPTTKALPVTSFSSSDAVALAMTLGPNELCSQCCEFFEILLDFFRALQVSLCFDLRCFCSASTLLGQLSLPNNHLMSRLVKALQVDNKLLQ